MQWYTPKGEVDHIVSDEMLGIIADKIRENL